MRKSTSLRPSSIKNTHAAPYSRGMKQATLARLLSEAKASGAHGWVRIIAGAEDGRPECLQWVRELLSSQPPTHWSNTSGWEEDWT